MWRAGLNWFLGSVLERKAKKLKGLSPSKRYGTLARKVVTFLALMGFCAASMPIPVGLVEIADRVDAEPFPCQGCSCGCKSARQCWTSCCCQTPRQRLAWAKKNGVTPPAYAVVEDDSVDSASICCSSKTPTACSACARKSSSGLSKAEKPRRPVAAAKRKWILSLSALGCQGKSTNFTLLPWTILVSNHELTVALVKCGPILVAINSEPLTVYLDLDTPPPRQMLS